MHQEPEFSHQHSFSFKNNNYNYKVHCKTELRKDKQSPKYKKKNLKDAQSRNAQKGRIKKGVSLYVNANKMDSQTVSWMDAQSPNYKRNTNKHFPYSEAPYMEQRNLKKIPTAGLIELVDYWGEGIIGTGTDKTGFTNCYNVNYQYKLVSNGPDRGRKIPNRVPVNNYNCDTSSYIKDNSVKIVTIMRGFINRNCSADIARMVNKDVGRVVVYGFDDSSQDIKNLDVELERRGLLECEGYILPNNLRRSRYNKCKAYLNITNMNKELYKNIKDGNYDIAVEISKKLSDTSNERVIANVVTKSIRAEVNNIMSFAFMLWRRDTKKIVLNCFPDVFKLIFNEDYVTIINRRNSMALTLDGTTCYNDEYFAWGDETSEITNRMRWKIIPVWEENEVLFKIKHIHYGVFLMLDEHDTKRCDREAWGAPFEDELNFLWSFEPVKADGELLFYIINSEYNQGLKLEISANSEGLRRLWGHHKSVYDKPRYYGWYIERW